MKGILTMTETWKPIPLAPHYEASTLGNIRSLSREILYTRKGAQHIKSFTGRVLKQANTSRGGKYKCVCIKIGKKTVHYTHRLVASAFLPNPESKDTVNHIDGNSHNNRLDNLEWATYSENTQHAYRTGLMANMLVSDASKKKIKSLWTSNHSIKQIAVSTSISTGAIATYLEKESLHNPLEHNHRPGKIDQQTADIIREIYRAGDISQRGLADLFDISLTTINFIVNNKIWTGTCNTHY
jgi:DNA-binding transcriptional regulator YiaG